MFSFPLEPFAIPGDRPGTFGKRSTARLASHTLPGTHQLLHMCWDYLEVHDRFLCCQAYPIMKDYARLRRDACCHRHTIREALWSPRHKPDMEPPLCPFRSRFMGAALLSFNFSHRDLVVWLGGEYTNESRNWTALADKVSEACRHEPLPGYPALEPELAMRAFTEGVPLAGTFVSERRDLVKRLLYDNHPPARTASDAVREKFAKEEANGFHIAYPRFLVVFIPGIMLSPISWIIQKGKGRLIIDASTALREGDTGAPNSYIPPPGEPGKFEENPPVFYGSALQRHLAAIWNLRIDYPYEDLLQHTDDIDSAFRRMLYHPDLAIVFAYVFQELLLVPVGNIFGSRNAPSWFTTPAEIRAHMANFLEYAVEDYDLAQSLQLPDEPTPEEASKFVQAVRDSRNQGRRSLPTRPGHHAMFVDDNACVATRSNINSGVAGAVGSAFDCYGDPIWNARRGSVLSKQKFDPVASFLVTFVGYEINTRTMRVSWPSDKRDRALDIIKEWLRHRTSRTPSEISQLLGLLRHGIAISAAGNFLSIRLQHVMSAEMARAGTKRITSKGWWHNKRIRIPTEVFLDLKVLARSLMPANSSDQWSRPIGFLIPRDATVTCLSDASYGGIGGWSHDLRFLWRITRAELVEHGFPMKVIDSTGEAPREASGLHINILEFVAIIINIWIGIWFVRSEPVPNGGHVFSILADNTSALSWLQHAARSRAPAIQHLAYLCQCLLLLSQTGDSASFLGKHIPGKDNGPADALSRPESFATLACAINSFSQLQTCRVFLLPSALLSTIAKAISSTEIGDAFANETMNLLRLEPRSLPPGSTSAESEVARGHNLAGKDDITDDTIRQYLSAAAGYLRYKYDITVPIFGDGDGASKSDKLNPYLAEILASRRAWKQPAPKKEAITVEMLNAMRDAAVTATKSDSQGWLSRDAVLYDIVILGTFTGSRLAEYGQSNLPPGSKADSWTPIPDNSDVPPEWRGKPLAFMVSDFEFFDSTKVRIPHMQAVRDPAAVQYVSIRFRYDKSNYNFTFRMFRRVKGSHLCAVSAALRLVRRALLGKLIDPDREPLGMFRGRNGQRYTIRGQHIATFLKEACVRAHPDPEHYMRRHIKQLMAHCLRVTAAVLLFNAGVSVDDISFRLRWNSDAVKLYLRDCDRVVDDISSKVFAGAFLGSTITSMSS